jgi:hypothetical protein
MIAKAPLVRRRNEDKGWLVRVSDWIDQRDIDKHFVSLLILGGTVHVTLWAMHYAENGNRPGLEVAAIIAAVSAPYMALQAAALKFYFASRTG